jgi:predicted transposase YbfD/YdcC
LNLFPPAYETNAGGHGRIEIRRIWCSSELQGYIDFPFHKQVGRIERITQDVKKGSVRQEVVYLITSLDEKRASPKRLLELSRGHWAIENSLHWVRDVTFDEDRSQVRTKSAPRTMATLRNLAVSVLRLAGHKNIARGLRFYAARPHLTLQLLKM